MTRASYVAAILLVFLMLGIPSFFMNGGALGLAGNAAADGEDVPRNFTMAVSELTVDTLNPSTYTMSSEGLVIFPVYSYLLQYDLETNVMGDAAREWSHSADGLLWNFKLWDNIYFIDPRSPDDLSHQLTGEDVRWSFWNFQNRTDGRLYSYFPGIIEAMWTSPGDPLDLWIQLNIPFASIQDSWLGMPILPRYYWDLPEQDFITFLNDPPIGSGAYYYKADNDPDIGTVTLVRNDHWHATENFGWQVHTDNVILKEELSDDSAIQDLGDGNIDVMLRVSPSLFLYTLPAMEDVGRFSYTAGFVYEYNLNQMSDALREELGGGFVQANAYNNQQLLLEPVREAMAMCVDKEGFVETVQYGLGKPACTLIPPDNPWHWEVPEEDKIPYDPVLARQILNDAGYVYDELGNYNPDATPLSSSPTPNADNTLSFRFYTLDTSDDWEYGSIYLAERAALAGVELDLEIHSVSYMNSAWYTANYDVWLWDWDMGVLGDGAGIMEVLTSYSIGTSSDVYWVNETYDDTYTAALYCMDPVYRHELVDNLQIMAYEQMGCQCVAYSANNYGVSTKNWNYQSLGDWNNTYELLPDVWYQWVAMQMSPDTLDNQAPYFTMVESDFTTEINAEETFLATALDDGPNGLLYRWFWGDGTKTDWSASGSSAHTYTEDGIYDVWVAVREDGPSFGGFHDNFTTVDRVKVTVRDSTNDAPGNLDFSWDLTDPDTGDVVTFTGSATDEEGDTLYYAWDFGEGHWLDGPEVGFQFMTDGYHSVTMYVTDDHIGTGDRPVSYGQTIEIRPNFPPTLDVPTFTDVPAKQSQDYTVTASDPEEALRLTWSWGDGTMSVTTVPTASHTYEVKGTYVLTVWADDLTGVDGHNVTMSNNVYVYNPQKNKEPVIQGFTASDTTPYTGQVVSFDCSATDGDGDQLTFTVAFGDGTYAVETFAATDPNDIVSWTTTHVYIASGTPTAQLYVSDGEANISSAISMTVSLNNAPIVDCSNVYGDTGAATTFTITADDYDGDTLSFTWEWGDGTTSTTSSETTTHTYAASDEYVYRVYVSDGKVESTDAAYAWINAVPTVADLIDFSYAEDLDYAFTADGNDPDGDEITYTWDFGDGTVMVGQDAIHQYADPGNYTYTVYVDDGFPLATHNVSASGEIEIVANIPYPPEVQDLPELWVTVDEDVTFTAVATDANGDPITFEWDFGDGSPTEMGQTVTHAYSVVNDYTYSVTVADDGGLETTKSNLVHVEADAVPIADAGPDQTVDEDSDMLFDGSDSWDDVLPIASFEWFITDLGVSLTGESPSYNFAEPGVYSVILNVTDSIGQYDTDEVIITVEDVTPPVAVAAATPATVDMGGTVTLDGIGSDDNVLVVSWTWVFFDGTSVVTLYGETVDHVFENAGMFTVTLTVADAAGNEGTDTVVVTVNDIEDPVAAPVVTPDPVELGEQITLNAENSTDNDGIDSLLWEIDLGTETISLTDMVSYYTFDAIGDYAIVLTVWDAAGNSDSVLLTVTVEDTTDPTAVATATPTTVTEGGTVTFSGSGSSDLGGIASYSWGFGDGSSAGTGVSVTHVYATAGSYTATLTVTDASGNSATDTVAITVNAPIVNQAPTADAGADQSVYVGATVTFDGSGSADTDGTIENYTWVVMDGTTLVTTLYGAAPTYAFSAAGTYTVTLTVTDDGDLTGTDEMTVTVTVAPVVNDPPVADASADDTSVEEGTVVEFSGAGSSDDVVAWTWTIVDEDGNPVTTLTGETASYNFTAAGTYTVTLNVTDAEGLYDTDSLTVVVTEAEEEPPPADDDEPSFIEQYGLALGLVAVLVVVALVAMMLLKKRKGSSGPSEPSEPSQ